MKNKRTILIASDHAGLELKAAIQEAIHEFGWQDLGPLNGNSVDYPDFAEKLSAMVAADKDLLGILICGSGIGMSISANKIHGIRAANVENPVSARLSREHNNANVLCLGSRFIAPAYGVEIAKVWLATAFTNDARHIKRIDKISALEARSTKK